MYGGVLNMYYSILCMSMHSAYTTPQSQIPASRARVVGCLGCVGRENSDVRAPREARVAGELDESLMISSTLLGALLGLSLNDMYKMSVIKIQVLDIIKQSYVSKKHMLVKEII
jgi:hypothetical protein